MAEGIHRRPNALRAWCRSGALRSYRPNGCGYRIPAAALEESLDILQDDELMESLRISRRQAADGDTAPLRDQV